MNRYALTAMIFFVTGYLPAQAQTVGAEDEVIIGPINTNAEWNQGFLKCEPQNSRIGSNWSPDKGWAIVSVRAEQGTINNGGGGIDLVAGGPSNPTLASVVSQFDLLLGMARLKNDTAANQDIKTVRDIWMNARSGLPPQNLATYYIWANSHGNCQDQKGGASQYTFYIKRRYVGHEDDLTSTVKYIQNKHFPEL